MVSVSSALKDRFDKLLSDAVSSKSLPALYYAVTSAGGPLYSRAVGTTVFDDPSSARIDEDAVFWLCSQTKVIVAIAVLQLIERGKIALDTPAAQILPELADPVIVTAHDAAGKPTATTPAKNTITLGQLLNHSSGMDCMIDGTTIFTGPARFMPRAYTHSYKGQDVEAFFEIIKGDLPGVPLKFEPGTDFVSGWGLDCAGFIVERLSGKTLEQYFRDHIFSPLGVTSMSFYLTPALQERLLPLALRKHDGTLERWSGPPIIDPNPEHVCVHLGGVGMYGSLKDYLAILQHLLQIKSGRALARPLLSRESVDLLFAPTLPPAAATTMDAVAEFACPHVGIPTGAAQYSCGLLLNTADIPGKRRAGSGGGWAHTSFFIDPTSGVAAVLGTQLLPGMGDDRFFRLYSQLEKELYAAIGPGR